MWLFTHILYCQINVAVVIPASYLPSPPSLSSALSPPFPLPLDGHSGVGPPTAGTAARDTTQAEPSLPLTPKS